MTDGKATSDRTASSETLVVIPARRESLRFPNKPLAELAGQPLIRHTAQRALEACQGRGIPVWVATDDDAIAEAVEDLVEVVSTTGEPTSRTGTDRVAAACRVRFGHDVADWPRYIVNVQGDEACLPVDVLGKILDRRSRSEAEIVTPCIPMRADVGTAIWRSRDTVKVVPDAQTRALYFSRAPIPHGAAPDEGARWLLHAGVYAFGRAALKRFATLPSGMLERREQLEQLRALEHGMKIELVEFDAWTDRPWPAINRPDDIEAASRWLDERSDSTSTSPPSRPAQPW